MWSKGNKMTVNSILTAYLITAILKALVLRFDLNLYFPSLNPYLFGPLVRFSGTRPKEKKPHHFGRFSEL
jgi:hypothetical protein